MAGMTIAVSGGIGTGKSVVCRVLSAMGYPVYDCDREAKRIMDTSLAIKQAIAKEICANAIDADGNIDRRALAAAVFGDHTKLRRLNMLVHGTVRNDIVRWRDACPDEVCFVETAILYESGLDNLVDAVWWVTAPEDLRIERVCRRNATDAASVRVRIEAQQHEEEAAMQAEKRTGKKTVPIVNDDRNSVLLQIHALVNHL